MSTAEKVESIAQVTSVLNESKAVYLADFSGIDVASVTELRNSLRDADVGYQVVKNRLAKRAAGAVGMSGFEEYFSGPTAIAFVREDVTAPARILQKFIDDGGRLTLKVGYVDGQLVSPEEIKALASLPSREGLIANVLGGVQSPLYGLVGVLGGVLRNLAGTLVAIQEQKQDVDDDTP